MINIKPSTYIDALRVAAFSAKIINHKNFDNFGKIKKKTTIILLIVTFIQYFNYFNVHMFTPS